MTQYSLNQGYVAPKLKSSLQNFYSHHDLVDHYEISISDLTIYIFVFI